MYSCIAHSFTNLFSLKFYVLHEVYDNMNLGIISNLLFLRTLMAVCLLKCFTTIVNDFSLLCMCSYEGIFLENFWYACKNVHEFLSRDMHM